MHSGLTLHDRAIGPSNLVRTERRSAARRSTRGFVWLVNHAGATVLRCRMLDESATGFRLRAPAGFGIAEGQRYELCARLPGEGSNDDSHFGFGRHAAVVRSQELSGEDEGYVDVGVMLESVEAPLSAF